MLLIMFKLGDLIGGVCFCVVLMVVVLLLGSGLEVDGGVEIVLFLLGVEILFDIGLGVLICGINRY